MMSEKNKQLVFQILKSPPFYLLIVLFLFIMSLLCFKPEESGTWVIMGSAVVAAFSYLIQFAMESHKEYERKKTLAAAITGEVNALLAIIERREYERTVQELIRYIDS